MGKRSDKKDTRGRSGKKSRGVAIEIFGVREIFYWIASNPKSANHRATSANKKVALGTILSAME